MTTVTLTAELEAAIAEAARERGSSTDAVVLEALNEKFLPALLSLSAKDALGEWERMMRSAAAQLAEVPGSEHAGLAEFERAHE